MDRVRLKLGAVLPLAALVAGLILLPAQRAAALFEVFPFGAQTVNTPTVGYALNVSAYPSALPNDGRSEADITVKVQHDGQPAPAVTVVGEVLDGGGSLTQRSEITDSEGTAHFPYRAGMMPAPGQLQFRVAPPTPPGSPTAPVAPQPIPADAPSAKLAIPLAPVTYLDLTLVTPKEYAAMRDQRQAASVVYKLSVTAFPQQLAADSGSMTTVICQLTSAITGKPAAGVALTPKLVSGDGQLIPDAKVTDDKGRLYVDFIAGSTPGTAVVRVLEPSSGLSQSIELTLVKAGPARIKLHYGNPQNVIATREGTFMPCDGSASMPLIAEVTDLAGIPLSNVELKLEIIGDATNGWLEVINPTSDAAGQVEFQYHSGSQPGKVRLRAYIAKGLENRPGWSS